MNKAELIEAVARDADLSKAAAGHAIDAVTASITSAVAKGALVAGASADSAGSHLPSTSLRVVMKIGLAR